MMESLLDWTTDDDTNIIVARDAQDDLMPARLEMIDGDGNRVSVWLEPYVITKIVSALLAAVGDDAERPSVDETAR